LYRRNSTIAVASTMNRATVCKMYVWGGFSLTLQAYTGGPAPAGLHRPGCTGRGEPRLGLATSGPGCALATSAGQLTEIVYRQIARELVSSLAYTDRQRWSLFDPL
jgi:hypothetical protein